MYHRVLSAVSFLFLSSFFILFFCYEAPSCFVFEKVILKWQGEPQIKFSLSLTHMRSATSVRTRLLNMNAWPKVGTRRSWWLQLALVMKNTWIHAGKAKTHTTESQVYLFEGPYLNRDGAGASLDGQRRLWYYWADVGVRLPPTRYGGFFFFSRPIRPIKSYLETCVDNKIFVLLLV